MASERDLEPVRVPAGDAPAEEWRAAAHRGAHRAGGCVVAMVTGFLNRSDRGQATAATGLRPTDRRAGSP